MPGSMVRQRTVPAGWQQWTTFLLVASFFVPAETLGGYTLQVALQFAAMIGVMTWVALSVSGAARPWVGAALGLLAALMLYLGSHMVYAHWQNDQMRQERVN